MLTRLITSPVRHVVWRQLTRNIGATAACCQAAAAPALDPIQRLFLDKIKDYVKKSGESGNALVDATPETTQNLTEELEKISRIYGASGKDMTQFPTFNFADVVMKPVGVDMEVTISETVVEEKAAEEAEDDDKPYFDF